MEEKVNTESIAMKLIAHSGNAKTHAFSALNEARNKNFNKASVLMEKAEKSIVKAHNAQTDLLVNEANGFYNDITILLIHAQDHIMTSNLAIELIKEIIYLYQK